uniref:Uncharacterized protein n=1 Tax=Arion vulgaris TaxID=1028688 RepID=A0A0B7ASZ9_9EUPU
MSYPALLPLTHITLDVFPSFPISVCSCDTILSSPTNNHFTNITIHTQNIANVLLRPAREAKSGLAVGQCGA